MRAGNLLIGFRANRSFFAQKRANEQLAQKNERFTHLLIFGEQPERFAQFNSLIFGERPERFTHIAHQKRGNERFASFFNKKIVYKTHIKSQKTRF